jgi:uncharacterized membrane-anchored protein YhcB (DUF1043 family)
VDQSVVIATLAGVISTLAGFIVLQFRNQIADKDAVIATLTKERDRAQEVTQTAVAGFSESITLLHELLDTTENIERQLAIRKAQEQERERAARREGRTQ